MATLQFSFIPIHQPDVESDLQNVLSDATLLKYMDLPSWNQTDEVAEMLHANKNGLAYLAIIYRNGFVCGIAGLSHIFLKHSFAYVTVGILPHFQRMGIGRRALAFAENLAFDELGLHRLEAQIHEHNFASLAMLDTNGYTREGIMRDNFKITGQYFSSVLFSKLSVEK